MFLYASKRILKLIEKRKKGAGILNNELERELIKTINKGLDLREDEILSKEEIERIPYTKVTNLSQSEAVVSYYKLVIENKLESFPWHLRKFIGFGVASLGEGLLIVGFALISLIVWIVSSIS